MKPGSSDVLDLCCGGKKCPVLRREGDEIVVSDPDRASGEIRLTRQQIETVLPWLSEWLRSNA